MIDRAAELDDFKRRVNLTEYAAAQGYTLDRRSSSRNSVTMRHPNGDKIIVAKQQDEHWVYFSVRDPADQGSIVDFVQRRTGSTLGVVRKELRRWTGGIFPADFIRPRAGTFAADLEHLSPDLASVRARYAEAWPIAGHQYYLEIVRRIPAAVLADPIFADRIREDRHGNAVFPHFDKQGLCGFELKNKGFTGFSPRGHKGLWASRPGRDDRRLAIAETAIDALSFAALKGQPGTRYVSTAGELNPEQLHLITAAVLKLPPEAMVHLALDNDAGGTKLAERIMPAIAAAARPDVAVSFDRPPTPGQDWNDVLRTLSPRPTSGPRVVL